jgi:hypothetical protein
VVALFQRKNGATRRDHGEDGLAKTHRPRVHGRRD